MEQLYLIEFMIDRVAIFVSEDNESKSAENKLIIKLAFGPKNQFIIKEQQMAKNPKVEDDIIECDENGRRKWSRIFRVGKSFLFPSYPDTVLNILDKFPFELEVWTDEENEIKDFVGIGTMFWEKDFYQLLKDSAEPCKLYPPLSIKQRSKLMDECCCRQVGEIDFILRISALGESITTEFQQLMDDPESFVFRTNRAPSMFRCKRVEGDDPNFTMIGSLYETTTLEDPDVINNVQKKIEVCTELQSCGQKIDADLRCEHEKKSKKKEYPIDKIKMGDIRGPCGNTNCALAHKVRCYIRNLDTYKQRAGSLPTNTTNTTKKVCGACDCKDDRYHREECPDKIAAPKAVCEGCGGNALPGHTCKEQEDKMENCMKPNNPKDSAKKDKNAAAVAYVLSVPTFKEANQKYQNIDYAYYQYLNTKERQSMNEKRGGCCGCGCSKGGTMHPKESTYNSLSVPNMQSLKEEKSSHTIGSNTQFVYNVTVTPDKLCLDIPDDKDCKCNPPVPTPSCKTFDCVCLTEALNIAARKKHKAYCPLYKHKTTCPVTRMIEDEEKAEEDEEVAEPLPYGLPPIKLGPCPVIGRPCSVPDGFARMYKTAAQPPLPPSYSDAGKVCCSKEFERIKAAIREYMKYEKERDMRCVNTFNVDTERRCCDKEQILLSQMGKSCCGVHKLAIQEKFKEDKK
ncbi:uncharacterized protein LOC134748244 isoform X1 [Cydia strobilella]|uniref:uncharacterized protein LOC134748244 isoform X1 n=1 Tax=Cydia strobilella TaxID=1100964 RepID=UPI003004DEBE